MQIRDSRLVLQAGRASLAPLMLIVAAGLVTAVMLVLGTRSFYDKTAELKPVILPYDIFWCAKDDHCEVVDQVGCCPCEQGGAQAAVTSWHRDDLRRFIKDACREEPVCVQIDLCRADAEAVCRDRRCAIEYSDH